MIESLAYWHSGGAVLSAGGWALSPADVEALHGLHREEADAATTAGAAGVAAKARRLAAQLATAEAAAARWRRASAPLVIRTPGAGAAFP